jgi:hypothetical protein
MDINVPTIDEMAVGIQRGVAAAVREAHARGLPVFVSDDHAIYAVYPDGRRVAVERLPDPESGE